MTDTFNSIGWLEAPDLSVNTPHDILKACREGAEAFLNSESPQTAKEAQNLLGLCELLEEAHDSFNQAVADPHELVTPALNRLLRTIYLVGAQANVLQAHTNGLGEIVNLAKSRMKSNAPLDEKNFDEKRYVARGIAKLWAKRFIEADTNQKLRTKDLVALTMAAMDGHRDIFELERSGKRKLPPERTIRESWLQDI
ncbi:MAG: hypothetical protein VX449_01570, partial [Pseudomonadota bacterium]|nr:hypothetical protein [Pseudomonadota bacterium]